MSKQAIDEVDLDNPPFDPPEGCPQPVLWRLAREKYEQHRRKPSGECATCPRWKQRPGTGLAKDGLATALGITTQNSGYWRAFAEFTDVAANKGAS